MALTCPRCLRKLTDSADPADRPVFCMYCGQRLRADPPPPPAAVMPDPAETVDAPTQSFAADNTPEADADRPADDPQPTELGGYRLGRFLGAGGMGTVYEAEAIESGQRVALKVLSGRLAQNPASVERFRQEGRVASQITHPHCVFVFRADADAGRPYIAMELMPGRTLKELVDEQGPLPVGEAIRRILDVIAGLGEAHRLGVIHRDVKPSNCFLTDDDRVKVGDFGLSKSLAADRGDKQLTHSGAFLGTVLFASPEQIRGEPVGYESDVYAVCGTLYYLLTGRAPYQHESLTAALAKAVSEPPPPIRPRRPDVSVELERVVLRGLERDRDRRWQSLDDLADALRELLPDNQRPARPRSLILAFLVDFALLQLLILPPEAARHFGLWPDWINFGILELTGPGLAVLVAYFALFEGRAGWTPGKWLLRMRVSRVGHTGPPGLGVALLRSAVFGGVWAAVFGLPGWLVEWVGGAAGALLALAGVAVGLGLMLFQLWPKGGWYRGVHDFASGCRTNQRPRPAHRVRLISRYPNPLDRPQPTTDPLPGAVGGFGIKGKLCDLPDGGEVWAAEDKGLARRVLVRVQPPNTDDPLGAADPVTRPTRLRAVGHGTLVWKGAERGWVGYVAPAGAPLVDVVDPARPLAWADARPLLEQLADELAAAEEDGSAVMKPAVEQVWVEPGGRLQLLDFPLPCGAASGGRQPPERVLPERVRPQGADAPRSPERVRPQGADAPRSPERVLPQGADAPRSPDDSLGFVREVAALALEGRPRSDGGPVRAPLPSHASRITDRLFADGYSTLNQLRADLEENHAHPAAVTAGVRAAHLGAQATLLAFGLVVMFGLSGLFSFVIAVGTAFQTRGFEEIRDMVRDPAIREAMLAKARQMPGDRADVLEWMERDLSPEGAEKTVRRLDELIARSAAEAEHQRQYLTRPERILLDRSAEIATNRPDADQLTPRQVEAVLRASRNPRSIAAGGQRWRLFVVFAAFLAACPAVWAACAFAFRGGLAMVLAGITLVRSDGRKAGRLRCAVRELLVWLPVTAVLLASMWVQAVAPDLVALRTGLWLVAGLMLPVYVVIALKDPVRPPQDRIMGTYLVPV
jgi:hypothetical protein